MNIDPLDLIKLAIQIAATWGIVAGAYYGIKGDIRALRAELTRLDEERNEADQRLDKVIGDHEVRLRVIERQHG